MNSRNSLPAFTLPELMVTLALTGLLLAMGQQVYGLFRSWAHRYEQSASATLEAGLMRELLLADLQQAQHWEVDSSQQIALWDDSGKIRVRYLGKGKHLLRVQESRTDTLPFSGSWRLAAEDLLVLQDSLLHLTYVFKLPLP